jgi:hypothetical protein
MRCYGPNATRNILTCLKVVLRLQQGGWALSNAALRAQSAISCFSHVRSAAFDPAGLKLAEGLLALAQAIEGLAVEQDDILSRLRQISA